VVGLFEKALALLPLEADLVLATTADLHLLLLLLLPSLQLLRLLLKLRNNADAG
jgi:hypothetical protein